MTPWDMARHEAGHAVAAWCLGSLEGAGPVTIELGGRSDGVCCVGRHATYPAGLPDAGGIGGPWLTLNAELRTYWEIFIVIRLAGYAALDAWAGHTAPAPPLPAVPASPAAAGGPEPPLPLPAAEAARLQAAAGRAKGRRTDAQLVGDVLAALHSVDGESDLIRAHRDYLQAEARELLAEPRNQRRGHAVASELMHHGELSADRWQEVIASCS